MDELTARVLEKIRLRKQQLHQETYSEGRQDLDVQIFVDNANVDVMNTSLALVRDLYQLNKSNDWVAWIMRGFEYDVNFRFEVSEKVSHFIPIKMILDWPLLFVVDAKRPVYSLRTRLVSRAQVAELADHAVLVLTQTQRLTSEANDLVRKKDLQLQVRNDAECIWQR